MRSIILLCFIVMPVSVALAESILIWPDFAPGETTKEQGEALPTNPKDNPPITRVEKITQPTMTAFLPKGGGNGAAVLVLPGGGFGYVVPDLEGSETAEFLNALGISVFVLNYRTKLGNEPDKWKRPLQDSQRAIRYLRANAATWGLDPAKIGLLAFSAGGQVGAIHIGEHGDAYKSIDAVDEQSASPDFAMLVYPWNVGDNETAKLMDAIKLGKSAPPTFLVHTDDDKSSALGAASIYMELKKAGVSAELHVYQNGGHGYGVRARAGSAIGTWKSRAMDWLVVRGIGALPDFAPPDIDANKDVSPERRIELAEQDIFTIGVALNVHRFNSGAFPSTEQGLAALVAKPRTGVIPENYNPTLKHEMLDPWGRAYVYQYLPLKNRTAPDISSVGPDGMVGTADDIGNWEPKK